MCQRILRRTLKNTLLENWDTGKNVGSCLKAFFCYKIVSSRASIAADESKVKSKRSHQLMLSVDSVSTFIKYIVRALKCFMCSIKNLEEKMEKKFVKFLK